MNWHDSYIEGIGLGAWFVLAMALSCMWLPFVFAAFALGRRQATIRFWLLMLFVEGAALAFFKLVVLDLWLVFSGAPGTTSRFGVPSTPNAANQTIETQEKAP